MLKKKHRLGGLLLGGLIFSSIPTAYAAPVEPPAEEAEALPSIFSAYVPAELPIAIDSDGSVLAPQTAVFINGLKDQDIQLESINVDMVPGWELVPMESRVSTLPPNTQRVSMSIRHRDLTAVKKGLPWRIRANGRLTLGMQAELPRQTSVQDNTKIATIGFTFGLAPYNPSISGAKVLDPELFRMTCSQLTGVIQFMDQPFMDTYDATPEKLDLSAAGDGSVIGILSDDSQSINIYSEEGVICSEAQTGLGLFEDFQASYINVAGLRTTYVSDMTAMFAGTKAEIIAGLDTLNTRKVKDTDRMFAYSNVQNLDLSGFDSSHIESMDNMFAGSVIQKVKCGTQADVERFQSSPGCTALGFFSSEPTTIPEF